MTNHWVGIDLGAFIMGAKYIPNGVGNPKDHSDSLFSSRLCSSPQTKQV